MRAEAAEGDVPVRVARDVEAVGLAELAAVAVARRVEQQHPIALAQLLAAAARVAHDACGSCSGSAITQRSISSTAVRMCRVGSAASFCFCSGVADQLRAARPSSRGAWSRRRRSGSAGSPGRISSSLSRSPSIIGVHEDATSGRRAGSRGDPRSPPRDSAGTRARRRVVSRAALVRRRRSRPLSPPPSSSSDQRSSIGRGPRVACRACRRSRPSGSSARCRSRSRTRRARRDGVDQLVA